MTGLYVASNPTALSAQFNLTRNMGELSNVLTRLSTGLKLNSGKDDPAGLIASELLKADITGTTKAITNTERANSMIATADSSLGQIGNLLNDVKGLVVEAANSGAMSVNQIKANQLQVDASLESIDRIARTTTYAGQRLLDGSLDFRTNLLGGSTSGISNQQITSVNFGNASAVDVDVQVQQAARKGTLIYNGTGVDQRTTIDVTGSIGTKSFTFGAGTTNDQMALSINAVSDSTGVQAYVEGKAQRGSMILSSTGGNNDILITANEIGKDAGNYTFRITHGGKENSVEIISEPDLTNAGVIEIRLKDSYDKTYTNFAGMFNVTIDGQYAPDKLIDPATGMSDPTVSPSVTADQAQTSVTIQKGKTNSVRFYEEKSFATGKASNNASATIDASSVLTTQSAVNGWTVKLDDSISATDYPEGHIDYEGKTIRINSSLATDNTTLAGLVSTSLTLAVNDANGTNSASVVINLTGPDMKAGDSFTLGGGGEAGELVMTYKEGATANDMIKLAESASKYASVSLASGVNGSTLIANVPAAKTHVETTWLTAGTANSINEKNSYSSSVSAAEVVSLLNQELGDRFTATMLTTDTGSGRVSFMDSSVSYGSVNLDNALRFTGMDDGPLVRLVTGAANQSLGVRILQPSLEDAAAGIHTPILEIQLATDASGNSMSTARDVAAFFDGLTAAATLGVSAEVLYPPGVDPNGRTFGIDDCGIPYVIEGCPADYGLGIVSPTGVPGTCAIQQNDLVLLGDNETIVDAQAVARISNGNNLGTPSGPITAVMAATGGDTTRGSTAGAVTINFGPTSSLNGVGFAFTQVAKSAGFNATNGNLMIYIDPKSSQDLTSTQATDGTIVNDLIDRAIAANWEAIREYTGANGDWTQAKVNRATDSDTNIAAAATTIDINDAITDAILHDTGLGGFTSIPPSVGATSASVGTMGVGENDPVLLIKAKQAGTDMAGVAIKFVQNSQLAAYIPVAGNVPATADPTTMELKVSFNTDANGNKTLIIEGNMGIGEDGVTNNSIDSMVVANSLNANADFLKYFTAEAPLKAPPDGAEPVIGEGRGTVAFTDGNKVAAITTGGYAVASAKNPGGSTTSSGISMIGASDSSERLVLEATEYGSNNFVKVAVAEGTFDTYCPLGLQMSYLAGTDVVATVNGIAATTEGTKISINTADLAMSMDVTNQVGRSRFSIESGGALFQLGSNVVSAQQMRVGIGSMLTTQLGGLSGRMFQLKSGGNADLMTSDNSRKLADQIVGEAISFVATTRGRLGAIQKSSLDPNISMLQDSLVSLTAAEASYSNADFAEESSNMTRLQLLVQAGMTTLGIANQFPQYAAQLIR